MIGDIKYFNNATDYFFTEVANDEQHIIYEQRDKGQPERLVAYEIHKRYASKANWWKTVTCTLKYKNGNTPKKRVFELTGLNLD